MKARVMIKGSPVLHGHCIHNDRLPETRTHNFTLKGLFATVLWIALWSSLFAAFAAHSTRQSQRWLATTRGRHFLISCIRPGENVGFAECAKCGLDSRVSTVQAFYGPCPDTGVSSK